MQGLSAATPAFQWASFPGGKCLGGRAVVDTITHITQEDLRAAAGTYHLPLISILNCLHSQHCAVLSSLLGGVIHTLYTEGSESLSHPSQALELLHLT